MENKNEKDIPEAIIEVNNRICLTISRVNVHYDVYLCGSGRVRLGTYSSRDAAIGFAEVVAEVIGEQKCDCGGQCDIC